MREALSSSRPGGKPQAHQKYWQELLGQVGGAVRPPFLQLTEGRKGTHQGGVRGVRVAGLRRTSVPMRRSLVSKWSQSVLKRILPKNTWGDTLFALLEYRRRQGRFPRLADTQFFSDQLYKLKVSGALQDQLRIFVTDKEYVKYYIAGVVGQQYAIQTYQVLRTKTDIDRLQLNRFPCVVKTHPPQWECRASCRLHQTRVP